jgi:hypothetical protein
MKIEFLPDGSEHCPLIRLYDFHAEEIRKLCAACRDLAEGRIMSFALHEQPWVEVIGDCRFVWRANYKNIGVTLPQDGRDFALLYSDDAWREVNDKLLRFTGAGTGGFNWLTNEGDVEVLISHCGGW